LGIKDRGERDRRSNFNGEEGEEGRGLTTDSKVKLVKGRGLQMREGSGEAALAYSDLGLGGSPFSSVFGLP